MDTMIHLVPPSEDLLEYLADRLCEADLNEIKATSGDEPFMALLSAVAYSYDSRVLILNGDPVVVYGCACGTRDGTLGRPWMFGVGGYERWSEVFLALSHDFVEIFGARHHTMSCHVDARNTKAIRWLKHLGFEAHPVPDFGVEGRLFYEMTICVNPLPS